MICTSCQHENPPGNAFCGGCGSRLLKQLTESTGDLRFGDEREVLLKGISDSQRVHTVEWK